MSTFHVAFRRAGRSILDRLIARFDGRGAFCHAELVFPFSLESFECHAWTGCRFVQLPVYDHEEWELVEIDLDPGQALAACRMTDGDHYDYLGVLRFVIPWIGRSVGRWFCSESVAQIVSVSGGPYIIKPYTIGPNELYAALKK